MDLSTTSAEVAASPALLPTRASRARRHLPSKARKLGPGACSSAANDRVEAEVRGAERWCSKVAAAATTRALLLTRSGGAEEKREPHRSTVLL